MFRPQDKGELKLQILNRKNNNGDGGTEPSPNKVEDLLDVTKEGPTNNSIKLTFEPKTNVDVGEEIEISAQLTSPSGDLECIFWVKIVDPQKEVKQKPEKQEEIPSIPKPIKVFEQAANTDDRTWQDFGWSGDDIVKVILENETGKNLIEAIAINMDSFSIKRFLSKNKINSKEQIKLVKDKYFLSVYLHTLFLYGILDKLFQNNDGDNKIDPEDMIPLIFKPYSAFLLASNTDEAILTSLKDE